MSKNEIKNTWEKTENLHQQEWGSILAEGLPTGVVKESTT